MSGGEYDPTVLPASSSEYPQSEYPPYPSDPYYGYNDGYGYQQPPGYWNYSPNDAYGGYPPEAYPAYPPSDPSYPAGTDPAYYDGGNIPANTAYVTPEEKKETPKEAESQPPTTETPTTPAGESKPEETTSFPATFPAGDAYSQPTASVSSPAVYPPSEPYDPTKPPTSTFPPTGDSASFPANGSYNGQPAEFPSYDRGNAGYPAGDYNQQGYYGYYPPYDNPPYFPRQPAPASQPSYPREESYSRGNWDRRETPSRNWDRREDPRGFDHREDRRSRSYERHDDRGRFDRHGASRPRFDRRELRPDQRGPREGCARERRVKNREDSCRIFVSGLDPQVSEQIIRDHFSPFGHVLAVKLPINHETGRQRDLALITMDSSESVDRAISQASHIIMGKRVKEICVGVAGSGEV